MAPIEHFPRPSHPGARAHALSRSRRFEDVIIEDEYEAPIGARASPIGAPGSDAVSLGGLGITDDDKTYGGAGYGRSAASPESVSGAYEMSSRQFGASESSASDGASAGYQYTFLEQQRRQSQRAGPTTTRAATAAATRPEATVAVGGTRGVDEYNSRSTAAQRELWPDVAAYARERASSPPGAGRASGAYDAVTVDKVNARKDSPTDSRASRGSVGSGARVGAVGATAYGSPPRDAPWAKDAKKDNDTASQGSWSFPFFGGGGGNNGRSPGTPPKVKSKDSTPKQKARATPNRVPWTPSPIRTPLGSRIPPNSPASARTVRSLEAQMRRAAAWAAGEDELIKQGALERGLPKLLKTNQGLPHKAFRVAIAIGHIKAFIKALESARIEKAHGGGAKLAVVAMCLNTGINALKNIITAASMQLGEKFVRKMAVPLALTSRASPLLLPATLSSMARSSSTGVRGQVQNIASVVVPPLSLISFIGAMWPIAGGQLVGDAREHYGTITHDVFLDIFPWVNVFLKHVKPVTNTLAIAASMELAMSGEEYAENGAFALVLAAILSFTSENRANTNHVDLNVREIRAGSNVLFMLALAHAECASRESNVWRRYVSTRQGGLEGATALGRGHGRLGGLGGFTRAVSRLPNLSKRQDDSSRRNSRRRPAQRDLVDADAPFVDRVAQRLPVLGPVLIILGGFVF